MATRLVAALGLVIALLLPGAAGAQRAGELGEREQRVLGLTAEIIPKVAELRGLDWRYTPRHGINTREELLQLMLRDAEADGAREEFEATSLVLHKLGLVDRGYDLHAQMLALYRENVGGFYNPRTRQLNLIVDAGPADPLMELQDRILRTQYGYGNEEMVIAHELTHALDDQHFDLLNLANTDKMTTDEVLAMTATLEGTAVSVQYDFLMHRTNTRSYDSPIGRMMVNQRPGAEALRGDFEIPNVVAQTILFPYTMGNRLTFEARRRENGGWDRVNRMFEDLPASTSQILHPEKYLDERVNPTVLVLPETLAEQFGDGWSEVDRDTFGQFFLWGYFEEIFADRRAVGPAARRAAEGWNGDTFVTLRHAPSDSLGLAAITTWETENDAREFFEMYRNVLQAKYPDAAPRDDGSTREYRFHDTPTTTCLLIRRGRDVALVESVPNEAAERVMRTLINHERRAWQRPPRDNQVPDVPPADSEPAVASTYWNGGTYARGADDPFALELPRAGFVLVREFDDVVAFRGPESERTQTVQVRRANGTWDEQVEAGFDEMIEALTRSYGDIRIIARGERDQNGPMYRVLFGATDVYRGRARFIAAAMIERDGRLFTVSVAADAEYPNEVAADLLAVVSSIREAGRD